MDVNDHSVLVEPTKKILAKFSYPKRIRESKIWNPTNPSIISVTKNPEYLHWKFVPPQISLSKVFISAYDVLITAKQIVDYEAESERPTSKKETTRNGKRTKYLLFFGNRNTLNWKTKHNSGENAWIKLQWGGVFGIKRLPRGWGEYGRVLNF